MFQKMEKNIEIRPPHQSQSTQLINSENYNQLMIFSSRILFMTLNYEPKILVYNQKMSSDKVIISVAILAAILGLYFVAQQDSSNLTVGNEPQTVPYVDVQSYLGVWYEQATIPYFFERHCTKTKATYSMNKDGTVRVDNSCVRNGQLKESVGKAIPEDSTNAKLKVEFVQTLDIGAQYWIVRLAKDYSYSVVSSPNYKYLWILYRQPVMPEAQYRQIVADLQKDGFPVNKLQRTQQ